MEKGQRSAFAHGSKMLPFVLEDNMDLIQVGQSVTSPSQPKTNRCQHLGKNN